MGTFLQLMGELERQQVEYILVGGLARIVQIYRDPCADEIQLEDLTGEEGGVLRYGPPEVE